jgi:hypothetical protein
MIRLGVQVHNGVPFLVGRVDDFAEVWGMVCGMFANRVAIGHAEEGPGILAASNGESFGIHMVGENTAAHRGTAGIIGATPEWLRKPPGNPDGSEVGQDSDAAEGI